MHRLTALIREDMVPALGVTEPGAIAFAAAKARSLARGALRHLTVSMNSGLYKNAYSCGIPGAYEVGAVYAAALGYIAGDPAKELETLSGITNQDLETARPLVAAGLVTAEMTGISSLIALKARLETDQDTAEVEIRDRHTRIVRIAVNGREQRPDTAGQRRQSGGRGRRAADPPNDPRRHPVLRPNGARGGDRLHPRCLPGEHGAV